MIDRRVRELINREVDGLNTKAETEELRSLLQKNQEANALFQGFKKLTSELKQVPDAAPPADLRQNILTAIGLRKKKSRVSTFVSSFIDSFRISPVPRYAVVFLLGAFVGFAVMAVAVEEEGGMVPNNSEMIGTFLPPSSPEKVIPADSESWDVQGLSGSLELHIVGNMALLLSKFKGDATQRVEVHFDTGGLELSGFRIHDGSISTVDADENTIGFVCESTGFCSAGFGIVSSEPTALVVRVYSTNARILEKTFNVARTQ